MGGRVWAWSWIGRGGQLESGAELDMQELKKEQHTDACNQGAPSAEPPPPRTPKNIRYPSKSKRKARYPWLIRIRQHAHIQDNIIEPSFFLIPHLVS